jgi:hypothetical protein
MLHDNSIRKNIMIMKDFITAKERLSFADPKLTPNYQVEINCDDCGEDIEECYFTNSDNQVVHVTTHTNGHYYSDGTARCEGCHDGSR